MRRILQLGTCACAAVLASGLAGPNALAGTSPTLRYVEGGSFDVTAKPSAWGGPGYDVPNSGPNATIEAGMRSEQAGGGQTAHTWHTEPDDQMYPGNSYTLYAAQSRSQLYLGAVVDDGPEFTNSGSAFWREDQMEFRLFANNSGSYVNQSGNSEEGVLISRLERNGTIRIDEESDPDYWNSDFDENPPNMNWHTSNISGQRWYANVQIDLSDFGQNTDEFGLFVVAKDRELSDDPSTTSDSTNSSDPNVYDESRWDHNRVWFGGNRDRNFDAQSDESSAAGRVAPVPTPSPVLMGLSLLGMLGGGAVLRRPRGARA